MKNPQSLPGKSEPGENKKSRHAGGVNGNLLYSRKIN